MKNFLPFIILSILISLIAISTYKLSNEQNIQDPVEEASEERDYSFFKTKIKLKNFSLNGLFNQGEKLNGSTIKQDDFVILNFFASWCTTCIAEHQILLRLQGEKIAKIYGIAWHDISENTKFLLQKHGNPYDKVFVDGKSDLGNIVGIKAIPETMIVQNGVVIYRYKGNLQDFHIDQIRNIIHNSQ